jgi:transcriptional regulator
MMFSAGSPGIGHIRIEVYKDPCVDSLIDNHFYNLDFFSRSELAPASASAMYLRGVHAESSTKALFEFIKANPLGVITTAIPSSSHHFLQSSHVPWVLDVYTDEPDAPVKGRLRGHMARQNPQSKAMMEACTNSGTTKLEQDVMILFTGAHHHYVTPKFYTETKPDTGKVVPTWNYAAAQVYGKATIYFDSSAAETSEYLSQQIHDLSQMCETSVMGYTGKDGKPGPWSVADAPERYVDIMKKNIIGIEVSIESIGGKFKMSQEMGQGDREGVIQGFNNLGSDVGTHIAGLVKERGEMKDAEKNKQ